MPVSLKPSDAVRSSLIELISVNRFAPKMGVDDLNKKLYCPVHNFPRSVRSAIEIAAEDSSVGKGRRELSRFLLLDALRILESFPEIDGIRKAKKDLIQIGKNLDGAVRTHLEDKIKHFALYTAIYPVAESDLTHLWAWDAENKDTIHGIISSIGFPAAFIGVPIAGSLLTLDDNVLGNVRKDVQVEYDMGIRDLRQYLTNLEFMRSEFV